MAANPFRNTAFDPCPQGIALLKRRGVLFSSTPRARLRDGLRRKGDDPPFVLFPLGTELCDRTDLTGDVGKAHSYHLLASVMSSGRPVLRMLASWTTQVRRRRGARATA